MHTVSAPLSPEHHIISINIYAIVCDVTSEIRSQAFHRIDFLITYLRTISTEIATQLLKSIQPTPNGDRFLYPLI